jgi:hypothetical protein
VAAQRPQVHVVDYGDRIDRWPDDVDAAQRPDGIHLTDAAALALVQTWLGPRLLAVAEGPPVSGDGSLLRMEIPTAP